MRQSQRAGNRERRKKESKNNKNVNDTKPGRNNKDINTYNTTSEVEIKFFKIFNSQLFEL